MHIRIANDNAPMIAGKPPRRVPRKPSFWRITFDPMITIPLCCTLALAVNAMLS